MFFKKKEEKVDIPIELLEELKKIEEKNTTEQEVEKNSTVERYSIYCPEWDEWMALNMPTASGKRTGVLPNGEDAIEYVNKIIDERIRILMLTEKELCKEAKINTKILQAYREGVVSGISGIIRLGISLRLNIDELSKFSRALGFPISKTSKWSTIIQYCLKNNIYTIDKVNAILRGCKEKTI